MDAELFEFEPMPPAHDGLREFLSHESKHGAEVLNAFGDLATVAKNRGWNLPVGADTLRGWARGTVKGFTLHNNLAPFYVAALALIRPDLCGGVLAFSAECLEALRDAGWQPSPLAKGGIQHE